MRRSLTLILAMVALFGTLPTVEAGHDPNDFWQIETTFLGTAFNDVHGTSATNVWAVGSNGALAHRTGAGWTLATLPQPAIGEQCQSATLGVTDVWSTTTNVFVIQERVNPSTGSADETCVRWGATGTENKFSLGGLPRDIWGFSNSDVWVLTQGRETGPIFIYHYNGVAWTLFQQFIPSGTERFPPCNTLYGVSSTDIWVFCDDNDPGFTLHYTGTTFQELAPGAGVGDICFLAATDGLNFVRGAWGDSTSSLLTTCRDPVDGSQILRWDGSDWLQFERNSDVGPDLERYNAISGSSATNAWVVGENGLILHRSGVGAYSRHTSPTVNDIVGVWTLSTSAAWAVSPSGEILQYTSIGTPSTPSLLGFAFDPDEFNVAASQAQCNGDYTSFVVNVGVTQTLSDLDVFVYRQSDHVFVFEIDDSAMWHDPTGGGAQGVYGFRAVFPPGEYVALGRADFTGLGALDVFHGAPFNVPRGTCTDTPYDDSALRAFIVARTNQTNGYVNSTSAAIIATVDFNQLQTEVQVNQVHSHIDSHFNQTWAMITDFEGNITAILNDLCSGGGCNFTVDNEPVIQALEAQQMRFLDLDTQTSWTFLLFLALLIWCWYQRWLFVAIASVIGILDAFMVPHVLGFKGTALVLVAGVVLQILVDMRDAWREKKEQEEASGGETT